MALVEQHASCAHRCCHMLRCLWMLIAALCLALCSESRYLHTKPAPPQSLEAEVGEQQWLAIVLYNPER